MGLGLGLGLGPGPGLGLGLCLGLGLGLGLDLVLVLNNKQEREFMEDMVYLISTYGITTVTRISALKFMQVRFKIASLTEANSWLSRSSIVDMGTTTISFPAGQAIGWKKDYYTLDKAARSELTNYWLVSPTWFRGEIQPHREAIDKGSTL